MSKETGFRKENVPFGEAIELIKKHASLKAYRLGWNGKEQCIKVCECKAVQETIAIGTECASYQFEPFNEDSENKAIVFFGTRGNQVGWLASQSDMFSNDWVVELDE